MKKTLLAALAMCVAVLAAALMSANGAPAQADSPTVKPIRMVVAPEKMPCVGVAPTTCLKVRIGKSANWTPLYTGIDGFHFRKGYTAVLDVQEIRHRNPAADGSSLTYRLLRVVSLTKA